MQTYNVKAFFKLFLCSTPGLISLGLGFLVFLTAQASIVQANSGLPPTKQSPQKCEKALVSSSVSFDPQVIQGQWVKYPQGDEQAQALFESLQGQGTGWCIGRSCQTTEYSVGPRDFYLYHSLDFEGKATIPRAGIATNSGTDEITEVRGRGSEQELDSFISELGVLHTQLLDFGDQGVEYLKKASDMRNLTDIYKRHLEGEELSREDLRFLYEIDGAIQGFGQSKPERVLEIISQRDIKSDVAWALGIQPEQVSLTLKEVLSGGIVYHYGPLLLDKFKSLKGLGLEDLAYINGDAYFQALEDGEGLESLSHISGSAWFTGLKRGKGLKSLSYIGKDGGFPALEDGEGLGVSYIGGSAWFTGLKKGKGLGSLSYIGEHGWFPALEDARGLGVSYIGGDGLFDALEDGEGLGVSYIGGHGWFNAVKTGKGLKSLSYIRGDGGFASMEDLEDLGNLYIGGHGRFTGLKTEKGLEKLHIRGSFSGPPEFSQRLGK